MTSCFLSDIHLGNPKTDKNKLKYFLTNLSYKQIYFVGDIVDIWRFNKTSIKKEIHEMMSWIRPDTKIVYVIGNHDEYILNLLKELNLPTNVRVCHQTTYIHDNGKKYLVIHGHQFDFMAANPIFLISDSTFNDFILKLNNLYNYLRLKLNYKLWRLIKKIKFKRYKKSNYDLNFIKSAVHYAKTNGYDGIICGHTHKKMNNMYNKIHYINCGYFGG